LFEFSSIKIEESGNYEVSYYVLMLCNQNGCNEAQDSIEVSIKIGDDNSQFKYDYSNIEMQKKWLKQTQKLSLIQGELKVITQTSI
jgi:hypothetical protein